MNMSVLVIKVQHDILDKNRKQLAQLGLPDIQISDFMSMLETPMCGSKNEMGDMAQLAGIDVTGMKGLGIDFGQCHVESFTAEDGKINMNCANGSAATQNAIAQALTALVSSTAYDKMFEERDGDGQFTDRQMFVKALMDYVDRDESQFGSSGQAEDYGYEGLKEPYRAKNNYIDTARRAPARARHGRPQVGALRAAAHRLRRVQDQRLGGDQPAPDDDAPLPGGQEPAGSRCCKIRSRSFSSRSASRRRARWGWRSRT